MNTFDQAAARIERSPGAVVPSWRVDGDGLCAYLSVNGHNPRLVASLDDAGQVQVHAASLFESERPDAVVLRAVLAPEAFIALARTLVARARGRLVRQDRDRRRGICRVGALRVHTGRDGRRQHPYWLSVVDLRAAGACRPMLNRLRAQIDWAPGFAVTDDMALLYGAANPHSVATAGARWLLENSDLVSHAAYDEVSQDFDAADIDGDDQRAAQLAAAAYRRTRRDMRRGRRAGWCHR